ncbi:AAA family ATPase [Azospirillum sp. sgz302134]
MKDRIHLSEVRLDNFRSFGPGCPSPLQAGPSVLVVAGPTGLGKTTLIEGIEWALTGRIRRFSQDKREVDRALTRRGADSGSHAVTLTFSDRKTITRGPQSTPALSDVLEVLRDPAWPHEIETLVPYLGLTHVLSQSSTLRLTSRDPQERWRDLSELTGAPGIEKMIERLGPNTKALLMRGANKQAEAREEFKEKRDRLVALLGQAREHDALLSTDSAHTAEQVLDDAKLALAEAEAARVAAAESVANKAAHLSALIKNLHEGDTECPLCLAVHKDGDLFDRAHRALERQDPSLTAATARVAEAGARAKACLDAITAYGPLRQAAADAFQPYLDRVSRRPILRPIRSDTDPKLVGGRWMGWPNGSMTGWPPLERRWRGCRRSGARSTQTRR